MKTWQIKRRAFTLVELLVVIAIIGILFVVLVSKVDFATDKAKTVGVQTDFRSFELAAHTVGVEQQGFVNDIDLLASQLNKNLDPKLKVAVTDDQIVTDAKDPWGTTYRITYSEPDSSRGQIVISSAGSDLKFDTDDDINVSIRFSITENGGQIEIENSTGSIDGGVPSTPSDPVDPDDPDQGDDEPVQLAAGLYDANDNLIVDWDTLTKPTSEGGYGMDIEKDYPFNGYVSDYVTAPKTVLNNAAFENGTKLVVADSIKKIGEHSFYNMDKEMSIVFGSELETIGYSAFSNSGLTGSLVIPSGVTTIDSYAFYECFGLTGGLVFPDNLTTLGAGVFNGCTGLTGALVIPDSITTIGSGTFEDCKGFTSLDLGSGVTSIAQYAFLSCSGFTGELIIPDSVTSIGNQAFEGCKGFTSLDLGNGISTIGGLAFDACSGFTGTLVIPDSVTSIGHWAFMNCTGLTGVEIGGGINSIGEYAFSGCSNVSFVSIRANNAPTLGTDAFNNTSLVGIYVPDASVETYKTTNVWSTHAALIKPLSEKPAE